jgi:hypothetical protein
MLRDVNPAAINCYNTTTEFIDLAEDYGITFTDPRKIAYNIIYRFGDIYDYVIDIIYMATPGVTLNAEGYNEIGQLAGDIFTETFYNFTDYEYPDITIVYPAD